MTEMMEHKIYGAYDNNVFGQRLIEFERERAAPMSVEETTAHCPNKRSHWSVFKKASCNANGMVA